MNVHESDGRQTAAAAAVAPAATDQWSSASLPLTGERLSLLLLRLFHLPAAHPRTVNHLAPPPPLFVLEELCLELARAIEAGDAQAASQHATALARQKAALTVQLAEKSYAQEEIG